MHIISMYTAVLPVENRILPISVLLLLPFSVFSFLVNQTILSNLKLTAH